VLALRADLPPLIGDEQLVRLLYDLGFAKARLAHSPRLHGRPLGLLGAFSDAFSSRCATERPAWQEGSRPANVLVRWVVQARDDPAQADLILAMVCSERLVAQVPHEGSRAGAHGGPVHAPEDGT
jgi:hypothetical protein